jgi:hypothetical protein
VGTPATVGIDDDLAARKASVALGPADDEQARGLDLEEKGSVNIGRRIVVSWQFRLT